MSEREDDLSRPFQVDALDVRGRLVRLGPAIDAILKRHAYPEPLARLIGEACVLTVLIGSSLKFDGRLTFQTATDGPINLLVVDFTAPESLRATARYDEEALAAYLAEHPHAPVHTLLGKGHLALTIDQGEHMRRYQGIVALEGESLEAAARAYFMRSEQIPTLVRLAVGETMGEGGARAWRAGGLFLQFLPEDGARIPIRDLHGGDGAKSLEAEEADDLWVEAESLAATVGDDELLDPQLSSGDLLYRLFHERGVKVFEPTPVVERCRCSADGLKNVFTKFSMEDRHAMVADGYVEAQCEFCSRAYRFTAEEILSLDQAE